MSVHFRTASVAALLSGLLLSIAAAQQTTIFDTADFRQDRALWTDPGYYRNNTVGELRGMALNITPYGTGGQVGAARLYGSEGAGREGAVNLASPYPFASAGEQYQAWLKAAGGGTTHTRETIPDWSGRWAATGGRFGRAYLASDVVKMLTPHTEYFVQELKASTRDVYGRQVPSAFQVVSSPALSAEEFIVTPGRVWTLAAGNGSNTIRWIYTDGSGHSPEEFQLPSGTGVDRLLDGDALVVHTNQIRGWKAVCPSSPITLETVERYRRVGDAIEGEITLYDPEVFVRPAHTKVGFELSRETRSELRPLYNTCTDTNGPSTKVFMDGEGPAQRAPSGRPPLL